MRNTFRLFFVLVLVLSASTTALSGPEPPEPVPLLSVDSANVIPGQYIVVFKEGTFSIAAKTDAIASVESLGGEILYQYDTALQGFSAVLSDKALDALLRNPNVAYIEQDQMWHVDGSQSPATWGIDRIDQRDLPLNNRYNWNHDGSGVHAYIIDTGIRITHNEFGGRAHYGYNAIGSGNPNDDHGHGTHVAGTVGGSTYGVAKKVELYAVKVCNNFGGCPISAITAGVDWVTNNHNSPAVANMSLGGSASTTIDNAVRNSIAAGIVYVVSAGNSNANACNYSPARVNEALTAGATTSSDIRSYFSNYGLCVDIFAPGSSIRSASNSCNTCSTTMSGTSMAAPHICGVAALYRDAHPSASTSEVFNAIINSSTKGRLSNIGSGSPNRLLFSLFPAPVRIVECVWEPGGGPGPLSATSPSEMRRPSLMGPPPSFGGICTRSSASGTYRWYVGSTYYGSGISSNWMTCEISQLVELKNSSGTVVDDWPCGAE